MVERVPYEDNHALIPNSFLPLFDLVEENMARVSKRDLDVCDPQQRAIRSTVSLATTNAE